MSASNFLRNVTAEEIKNICGDSDEVEDAANGKALTPQAHIVRMGDKLAQDYPGLYERIRVLGQEYKKLSSNDAFVAGVMAGAIMLAHEITITAEVHESNEMLG